MSGSTRAAGSIERAFELSVPLLGDPCMRHSSGLRDWARTHTFRVLTALLTLVLFGLSFFYSPELLTWWLRTTMRLIEATSSLLPYPWGDRIEIALRGFGGSFWFQIAFAIIVVRLIASLIAWAWRQRSSKRRQKISDDSPQNPSLRQ